MTEEKKPTETQPKEETGNEETGTKSAEELKAELKAEREEREKLEKQVNDQKSFIGRQSSELGDLRKKVSEAISAGDVDTKAGEDALFKELTDDLVRDGQKKEDAEYNARLLIKGGKKVIERERAQGMMDDVADMVEDALEDGTFNKSAFNENKADIMAEFKGRKLQRTAKKNFRIFRDCYQIVVKRKAEKLKEEGKGKEEEARTGAINATETSTTSTKKPEKEVEEDKKAREAISGAGSNRGSAFF